LKILLYTDDQEEVDKATKREIAKATDTAKQKAYAIAFLQRADKGRYGLLITHIENQFTLGSDQYPTTITGAYNLLIRYVKRPTNTPRDRNTRCPPPGRDPTPRDAATGNTTPPTPDEQLAFLQHRPGGANEPPIAEIQRFRCQQMGHYANGCSNDFVRRTNPTVTLLQCATITEETTTTNEDEDADDEEIYFSLLQAEAVTLTQAHMIDQHWILLDSESTVNILSNHKFLNNIRHCGHTQGLRIPSNGGTQDTHMIGDLPGFGTVWYNAGSLANILSLAAVRKVCQVTMDTLAEAAIVVHKHDGTPLKFTESSNGLYYYDASKASKTELADYLFVHSVVN
jgi:hypothetical protein